MGRMLLMLGLVATSLATRAANAEVVPPPAAPRARWACTLAPPSGELRPDAIQRTIRRSSGGFRGCYARGLQKNPSLHGTVYFSFVIGRSGGVGFAANSGSDLPDAAVIDCVIEQVTRLSFPAPEGGALTVSYGFHFMPSRVELVRAAIARQHGRLAQCARPGVEERLDVRLVIAADGSVARVRATSSAGESSVSACVENMLAVFRLPEDVTGWSDASPVEVDYALTTFGPPG